MATKPLGGLDAPLAVARWLASREERQLHEVAVLEPNDGHAGAAGLPPLPAQYYDEERAALAESIKRELVLHQSGAEDPRVDVLSGPSVPAIIDAARESHARVIVVGTGRHDRLGRFVYGERALQILSESDRPVLIVPRDAHAGAVTVAVVAVDFSPASLRAARAAIPMLSEGGRLILVHVKSAVSLREDTAGWWNDAYERRCADLFAQFQRQLPKLRGITVESKFLRGEAGALDSRVCQIVRCGPDCVRSSRPLVHRAHARGERVVRTRAPRDMSGARRARTTLRRRRVQLAAHSRGARGSENLTFVPTPSMLSIQMLPPCASTIPREIGNPRPAPCRVIRRSSRDTWKNRSKT